MLPYIGTADDLLFLCLSGGWTDKTSNLAIATLNYITAAQTYFGYGLWKVANASLSEEQKTVSADASVYGKDFTLAGDKESAVATFSGATLFLNGKVDMKFFFANCADGVADAMIALYEAVADYAA